ncbi:ABC transporter permease [Clavibacter michiganensis subsp. tessellarius]|uniref:ABC transporter permease n=1 Tax=Clavibacter tessellarius TaxID=31965 RepID=UPI001F215970|nr:ABC transporter permease [Clavibacter michiganensis]
MTGTDPHAAPTVGTPGAPSAPGASVASGPSRQGPAPTPAPLPPRPTARRRAAIYRAHVVSELAQNARMPAFVLPLLAYPVLIYVVVGLPQGGPPSARLSVLLGYVLFSVLGTVTFQFGVGVASARESPWERWLFTAPVPAWIRLAAKLTVACVFGVVFVIPVIAVGVLAGGVRGDPATLAAVALAVLAGAVPMALLGLAMGYWFPARGALGLANLVYLPLSFAGGLFTGGDTSGTPWDPLTVLLPTGAWSTLTSAVARQDLAVVGPPLVILAAWAVLLGGVTLAGYQRTQSANFR